MYYVAIFLTLMLVTQARRFLKLEFYLSWWAYSFPSAAITIATLLMYERLQLPFFRDLCWQVYILHMQLLGLG